MLTRRLSEALDFAVRAHGRQTRKGSEVPYVSHLLGVASLVLEGGGSEDLAIAGLLHDVLEDTEATIVQLQQAWGDRIASIVEQCSDTTVKPKPPSMERKRRYLEHLEWADQDVLLVSLADKLHNARSLLMDVRANGSRTFDRFNVSRDETIWYYRQLSDVFSRRRPGPMADELSRATTALGQSGQ